MRGHRGHGGGGHHHGGGGGFNHHHHHHRHGGGGGGGFWAGMGIGILASNAGRSTTTTYVSPGVVTTTGDYQTIQGAYVPPPQRKRSCAGCLYMIGPIIVVVYIILVATLTPHTTTNSMTLGLSETSLVNMPPVWYQSMDASSVSLRDNADQKGASSDVKLLRFSQLPPLSVMDSWQYVVSPVIYSRDNYHWNWNLLPGSDLYVKWQYSGGVTVYIVKSTSGYNDWVNGDESSVIKSSGYTSDTISLIITEADTYYFIIESTWYSTISGSATISVTSKLYDVTNPISACTLPCSADLDISTTDVFILTTPRVANFTRTSPDGKFEFDVTLNSRAWFVAIIIYIIPVLILVAMSACCMVTLRRKMMRTRMYEADASTPILSGQGAYVPAPQAQPYAPTLQPYTPTPQPYSAQQQPYAPQQQPYTQQQQPYAPQQQPYAPQQQQQPYAPQQQQQQQQGYQYPSLYQQEPSQYGAPNPPSLYAGEGVPIDSPYVPAPQQTGKQV